MTVPKPKLKTASTSGNVAYSLWELIGRQDLIIEPSSGGRRDESLSVQQFSLGETDCMMRGEGCAIFQTQAIDEKSTLFLFALQLSSAIIICYLKLRHHVLYQCDRPVD